MHKEQITDKEAFCLLSLFIIGTSLILGVGGQAKNDAWIVGILGTILAIPIILVYARISYLYPGKDLFQIIRAIFGNFMGRALSILYIWYAFHLGALVIRNFGEFVNIVSLPETPMMVGMLSLGLVGVYAVRSGVEILGRISAYIFPMLLVVIVLAHLLTIPQWNIDYLKPVLGNGMQPVLSGVFQALAFPFAETILFVSVFQALKTKKSPYKVFLGGLLFTGVVIAVSTFRNIVMLGSYLDKLYFPSYVAVSRVSIGDFVQRVEVAVVIIFVFGAFLKYSVCLLTLCQGIADIFSLRNYRSIVLQAGLLMVYFAYTVYDNAMEMEYWAFKVYPYYAFPFQIIIPCIIWLLAEVKVRRR